jgi:sorting nexin-1/2
LIVTNISFSIAEKFRFSAEFIEMRRQALDMFVNRVASHHDLQQSEDLRTFLQADEEVMFLSLML